MSIGVHRVRERGLSTGLDEHAGLQAFRTRGQDRHLGGSIQISNNWKLIYPLINRHHCASCSAVAGHSPATNTSNTQLILLEILHILVISFGTDSWKIWQKWIANSLFWIMLNVCSRKPAVRKQTFLCSPATHQCGPPGCQEHLCKRSQGCRAFH